MEKEKVIEIMAKEIWHECYRGILSYDQIEYMLNKFLSYEVLKNNDSLNYEVIDQKGFYAYTEFEDHIFISKLYIKKEFRAQGIAKKIITSFLPFKKPIRLTVNKKNPSYFAYLALGFKMIQSLESDIGEGYIMDDYLMEKEVVYEPANAKVNLDLKILGKRTDGYHDLVSKMVPLTLADEIIITTSNNFEYVTNIKDDIIIKTYNLLKEKYHVEQEAHIILNKHIPLGAGLAGGSADCAAVLRGLNKIWKLNLSLEELAETALLLGSDTVFCLYNKPAIVTGRGEKLAFFNYQGPKYIVLVNPKFEVSTKVIFENYHGQQAQNDLEPVVMNLYPALKKLQENLNESSLTFKVTGSGPTLFALSDDEERLNKICQDYSNGNLVIIGKILL